MSGTLTIKKTVAARYATALLSLANKKGEQDRVLQDLQSLKEALNTSKQLNWVFNSPVLSSTETVRLIQSVKPLLGLSETVYGLIVLLAKKGRLTVLSEIESRYVSLLRKQRQEMLITITSAVPMPMAGFEQIARQVAEKLRVSVRAEAKIDPSLKAGFIVHAGSLVIDASLKSKLSHIRQSVKGGNA